MPLPSDPAALADLVVAGDIRAGARAMRIVENRDPRAGALLRRLHPATGRAYLIGITGNPGSGKSTLGDRLIAHYRRAGLRVGVVAVDPSSPYTGGAILGDRIRMQSHATDPGVFIRSMATRGHLGGLARATNDVVNVLDAMGYDIVLIETVGVGQDEIDIVQTAYTSIVIVVPGLGDEIQSIKAGILEIADVFAINKADHPGVDRTLADLRAMQALMTEHPPWLPPIVKLVAVKDEGIADLAAAIDSHRAWLGTGGALRERQRSRDRHILQGIFNETALAAFWQALEAADGTAEALDRLARRDDDPYSLVERIWQRMRQAPTEPPVEGP